MQRIGKTREELEINGGKLKKYGTKCEKWGKWEICGKFEKMGGNWVKEGKMRKK